MKSPSISYRVIGNSGPLSLTLSEGPFGNAVESKQGNGVVWLSSIGELLAVEFDDVQKDNDYQKLTAPDGTVIELTVKKSKVSYEVIRKPTNVLSSNRRNKILKEKITR